mmetsp:Transcript_13065/g.29690  ORF Transcript_13065/g.29690 Transcript_13065/m.29690 type:complete len:207 (-) Transcript_13065:128-748(-)
MCGIGYSYVATTWRWRICSFDLTPLALHTRCRVHQQLKHPQVVQDSFYTCSPATTKERETLLIINRSAPWFPPASWVFVRDQRRVLPLVGSQVVCPRVVQNPCPGTKLLCTRNGLWKPFIVFQTIIIVINLFTFLPLLFSAPAFLGFKPLLTLASKSHHHKSVRLSACQRFDKVNLWRLSTIWSLNASGLLFLAAHKQGCTGQGEA